MFSPSDYELAARVLGLPVPRTQAEMAAATPMTARVVRDFARGLPPVPVKMQMGCIPVLHVL